MDTIGCADEINTLNDEIKLLSKTLKDKRNRLFELREGLDVWLQKTGESAVRHKGKVIYKITKTKTTALNKKEKEQNAIEFLQSIGVSDTKYVLEKLKEVQKGDSEDITQICIDDEMTYKKKMDRERKRTQKKSQRGGRSTR